MQAASKLVLLGPDYCYCCYLSCNIKVPYLILRFAISVGACRVSNPPDVQVLGCVSLHLSAIFVVPPVQVYVEWLLAQFLTDLS